MEQHSLSQKSLDVLDSTILEGIAEGAKSIFLREEAVIENVHALTSLGEYNPLAVLDQQFNSNDFVYVND